MHEIIEITIKAYEQYIWFNMFKNGGFSVEKKVMNRKASENEYLHKDFHGAMSCAIDYLHKNYGEDAVREYLRRFAKTFYVPLIKELNDRGLIALKEHFERIYRIEGGDVEISLNDDELIIQVNKCPAVTHLRNNNRPIASLFYETTKTVNEALCEDTRFKSMFSDYNENTGGNIQRFFGRDSK